MIFYIPKHLSNYEAMNMAQALKRADVDFKYA
jgi:hypothetical protein